MRLNELVIDRCDGRRTCSHDKGLWGGMGTLICGGSSINIIVRKVDQRPVLVLKLIEAIIVNFRAFSHNQAVLPRRKDLRFRQRELLRVRWPLCHGLLARRSETSFGLLLHPLIWSCAFLSLQLEVLVFCVSDLGLLNTTLHKVEIFGLLSF
ncbi:hypothetical protein BV898_09786 [Hypsibius exemplaris]|uniref:Uncharacterized protein n=1 Tax=Hypsibius exemplaris TaxID=2072580 RepID=A0A1W0WLD0_HYPEX|nr:hypothetical protein BV898_09786 [Hypsibius exemplaris]